MKDMGRVDSEIILKKLYNLCKNVMTKDINTIE